MQSLLLHACLVSLVSSAASILIPPPDVKLAAEKLAKSVAAMGPDLEKKVVEENAANPRFSFLNPWNMFHAYYKDSLRVYRNEVKAERRRQRLLLKQKAVVVEAQIKARALARELVTQHLPKETNQPSTPTSAYPEALVSVPVGVSSEQTAESPCASKVTLGAANLLGKPAQESAPPRENVKASSTTPSTSPTPEQDAQYKKQLERKKKAAEFMLKVQQQGTQPLTRC